MKYDVVLWDFDGTLVDTSEGIFSSLRFAFEGLGLAVPTRELLRRFIGPPIARAFREYVGLDEAYVTEGVRLFRADYHTRGILVSEIYAGIPALLVRLRAQGIKNAVSTLKPEAMALRLLDKYGLTVLLDACCGTTETAEESADKSGLVLRALAQSGCADGARAVLVGDTLHDARGAQKAGVDFIAAAYGYGFRHAGEPLPADTPAAHSVEELERLLLS